MSASVVDASSDDLSMGVSGLPGRNVLEMNVLRSLSRRSDVQGFLRFGIHIGTLFVTGTLIWLATPDWRWMLPAMVVHGFIIVTLFAPMHECVHRTAFSTPVYNEICGWVAGLLSFYNFTFYRYYHTWHHRYTQDPERDPELQDPKAASLAGYAAEISGLWFWPMRPWNFLKLAMGWTKSVPFIPESARSKIALSAAIQLSIYVVGVVSIIMGFPYFWQYWFLPAFLAEPFLRAFTIAEHTGCTIGDNGLTNTRTTLASFPVRLFMWNMPFHTEHHLYPSIPFHQLPEAHRVMKAGLANIAHGYIDANLAVIRSFDHASPLPPSADPSTDAAPSEIASTTDAAPAELDAKVAL